MAKELIWTETAKKSRKEILKYWINRNKSSSYSKKLNELFNESSHQILKFPFSGIQISENFYRGKLIKDYYLIYKIEENFIIILLIWDTRQNPSKLLKILKLK